MITIPDLKRAGLRVHPAVRFLYQIKNLFVLIYEFFSNLLKFIIGTFSKKRM
jgi:hypothetical protein